MGVEPIIPVPNFSEFLVGPLKECHYGMGDPFTLTELDQALHDLNSEAATGPDGISSKLVLRIVSNVECKGVLLALYNDCLRSGSLPTQWGESEISVLFKGKGSRSDPSNYRGINILNSLFKIFERLVYQRVLKWAEEGNLLGSDQYGFRSGRACADATFAVMDFAEYCVSRFALPVFVTFVDLEKAFPSVLRSKLLARLVHLGLHPVLIQAISAMFAANSAKLKIGQWNTRVFLINKGVREGGVLSPILFALLFAIVWTSLELEFLKFNPEASSVFMSLSYAIAYADDLALITLSESRMQHLLLRLEGCLEDVGLRISTKKTKFMVFSSSSCPAVDPSFFVYGTALERVSVFCYLGTWLDSRITGLVHRRKMVARSLSAAKTIGSICKDLELVDFALARVFYLAFVSSQYCGLELSTIDWAVDLNDSLRCFLRSWLCLPAGFPNALLDVLIAVRAGVATSLRLKAGFFSRALSYNSNCTFLSVFLISRRFGMPRGIGWHAELVSFLSSLLNKEMWQVDITLDLPSICEQLHSSYISDCWNRVDCFPSLRLFAKIFPSRIIHEEFRIEIGRAGFEIMRLLIIFLGGSLRWSFFRRATERCRTCDVSFSCEHFFSCSRVQGSLRDFRVTFTSLIYAGRNNEWRKFFDLVLFMMNRWCDVCDFVAPRHVVRIKESRTVWGRTFD